MSAPLITLYEGDAPARTQDSETFSDNVDDFLGYIPGMVDEMNTQAVYTNAQAEATETAANLATTAISGLNFKGEWSSLSGALAVPSTVYHDGTYWQLLDDIADVAASEPSVVNSDYALAPQLGGRVVIEPPITLAVSGRYYIIGDGAVTLPDPDDFSDGMVFDFSKEPQEQPTITAPTNTISSKFGLDDEILMDLGHVELIVRNSLYEV